MNITASGYSASVGGAAVAGVIPANLASSGTSRSSGSAVVQSMAPLGAVCDFGVWPSWMPDPAMSLVQAVGAPDSTGRAYLSATAPAAYQTAAGTLWNTAAFAAVTGTWNHGAANSALTQVQFEHLSGTNLLPSDAADYRDQLVYTQGFSTTGGVTTWDAAVERVTGHALSGDWCGQMTNSGGLSPYSMAALPAAMTPVVAGATYQGKVSLSLGRAGASWAAQILWFDAGYNLLGSSPGGATSHPGGFAYQQAVVQGLAEGVYAAVVPLVHPAAVGDGEIAYVDCHRLTALTPKLTSAPSAFNPAREQIVTLKANRINYFTNPSFTNDITGWWSVGGSGTSPAVWDPTVGRSAPGSLKMSVPYSAGTACPQVGVYTQGVNGGPTPGIAPGSSGGTYTLSAYVQPTADCPTLYASVAIGGGTGATTVAGDSTQDVEPDAQGWYRLSATFTIPESVAGSMSLQIGVSPADWVAHAGAVDFWVDDCLGEASPLLGTYFDGAMPSPDYLWEGTAFRSRTHYYQNLRFLQYRLSELLEDALPVGVAYQLLFAQPDT